MIQAIVYDAVGTLIHVQPAVALIYANFGRQFGSRVSADEIQSRFHAAFARQDRLDEITRWRTSEVRERQRWRDIVAEVLDDVADPGGCFEALYAAFGQSEVWTSNPDAIAVLTTLASRGYRQSLASNFDRRLHAVVADMPIARHLESLVISSEIGWRKPAPEFFRHLADSLRLPPDSILFIGDDRTNDFDGARSAGMSARLLDPKKKHLDVANRIERLGELLDDGEVRRER